MTQWRQGLELFLSSRGRHTRFDCDWSADVCSPDLSVDEDLVAHLDRILDHFPTYWATVVRNTDRTELSLQPVYDAKASTYVSSRILIAGDAGTVARPHTVSGVTKAIQDAFALQRLCV